MGANEQSNLMHSINAAIVGMLETGQHQVGGEAGIKRAYDVSTQNLLNMINRLSTQAGARGRAQTSALNLSNPYALINRNIQSTYGQLSPLMGQLNEAYMKSLVDLPQRALQNWMALQQLRMGLGGGMSRGFSASDIFPGLLEASGKIGAAAVL